MKQEDALVILLGRIYFDDFTKTRIYHLIKGGIDWYDFLNVCVRRKLICLVYKNLIRLHLIQLLPLIVINNMQYHYEENCKQNTFFIDAVTPIISYFKQNNILATPVKGLRFLKTIYADDLGVRILEDVDFISTQTKKAEIYNYMHQLGYETYLVNNQDAFIHNSIVQSYFFIKYESDNPYGKLRIDFDFSYSDFWVESIYSSSNPVYEFLFLCKNYYKDMQGDLHKTDNTKHHYRKLIDIHEYYIKYLGNTDMADIYFLAAELHIKQPFLYTMSCLKNIYNDIKR